MKMKSNQDFAAELKKLTRYCKFPNDWFSDALCTQCICGLSYEDLQVKFLTFPDLSFSKAVKLATSYEISKNAAKNISENFTSTSFSTIIKLKQDRNRPLSNKSLINKCLVWLINRFGYRNHTTVWCYYRSAKRNKCFKVGHCTLL